MKYTIAFLALAAAFTLLASPTVLRHLFAHPDDQPPTPAGHQPKFKLGDRYVTQEEFTERIAA